MPPRTDGDDPHFRYFAKSLQQNISAYGTDGGIDRQLLQKKQLQTLLDLEERARELLIEEGHVPEVYGKFIAFINRKRHKSLEARPYFRARTEEFTAAVSPAIKAKDVHKLATFQFNHDFMNFAVRCRKWPVKSKFLTIWRRMDLLRHKIAVQNMPLAINRATIFFRRTQKSHLSRMDMIQIAAIGLLHGIDKYSPGDGDIVPRTFRATAMGRMTGMFINNYSQTQMHFNPRDKRMLYRANKAVGRSDGLGLDYDQIVAEVDDGEELHTTPDEIQGILAAASFVSVDGSSNDPETPAMVDRHSAPDSTRPDVLAEQDELRGVLARAVSQLTLFEQKVIALTGVDLDSISSAIK